MAHLRAYQLKIGLNDACLLALQTLLPLCILFLFCKIIYRSLEINMKGHNAYCILLLSKLIKKNNQKKETNGKIILSSNYFFLHELFSRKSNPYSTKKESILSMDKEKEDTIRTHLGPLIPSSSSTSLMVNSFHAKGSLSAVYRLFLPS